MATKVKPCRIKATGTPQVGYVPKYVDEDTFQWGTGGGGSDIEYVTQAEYTALLPGAESDGKHYFIFSGIAVTGVTLDESSITLTTVGDTYQLTATVSPNDAYDKSVTWNSSDNTVATVSQTGLVTCVTPGTCTITVTTNDGGFTATCGVDDGSWTPDISRTIFYYEFEQNLDDSSGNSHNISSGSSYTYDSVGGQYVLKDNGSINLNPTPSWINTIGTGDYTVAFWLYPIVPTNISSREPMLMGISNNQISNGFAGPCIFFDYYDNDSTGGKIRWRDYRDDDQGFNGEVGGVCANLVNGWHHLVMTRRSGTVYCYIDTVEVCNFSSSTNINICNSSYLLGGESNRNPQGWGTSGAMMDKFIVEKVGWNTTDISNYYDQTKSIYGIS